MYVVVGSVTCGLEWHKLIGYSGKHRSLRYMLSVYHVFEDAVGKAPSMSVSLRDDIRLEYQMVCVKISFEKE